jgi:immunity protein, SdpI family
MRLQWRTDLPAMALLAAMLVSGVLAWTGAPLQVPVHDFMSTHARMGSRFEGLLAWPLLALLLYGLLLLLPRVDPGGANYATFAGPYAILRLSMVAFLSVLHALNLLALGGHRIETERVWPMLLGAQFVVLGGVFGKIRPNWFVGIRTPWTLSSKAAWTRTHRLGGWLCVVTGLCAMGAAAIGSPRASLVLGTGGLASVVVCAAYSYYVWRNDPDKVPPAGSLPADEAGTHG